MQQYSARYPAPATAGIGGGAALHPGVGGGGAAYIPTATPPILATPPQNSDSVLLVTAGYDHTIRFWQAWQSECTRTIRHAEGQINRLAISPDRRFLAVAANQAVRVYDCTVNSTAAGMAAGGGGAGGMGQGQGGAGSSGAGASGGNTPLLTLSGHVGNVTTVCWQQDLKWLATSSEDGTVKIWDFRSGKMVKTYGHNDPVNDVVVHPNQGELISCDDGGKMMIWDLAESKCTYNTRPEKDSPLRSVTVASDASCLVAGGNSGKVFLWKMGRDPDPPQQPPPPQPKLTDRHPDELSEAERDARYEQEGISPTNTNGASSRSRVPGDPVAAPGRVRDDPTAATSAGFAAEHPSLLSPLSSVQNQAQSSLQEGSELTPLKEWTAHSKYLIRALLSPNVRYLATCGADTTIKIWNMDNFDCGIEKTLLGHQRWVWDLAFSADSGFLVSASSDHAGRLWDINTGETVRTYTGHDKAIVAVALNDQDRGKPHE
ncbi:hypothetical protein CF326_g126 [Tilletia indica]|nr:hypothetical protein CF326_g126 [Tilletia indica]